MLVPEIRQTFNFFVEQQLPTELPKARLLPGGRQSNAEGLNND